MPDTKKINKELNIDSLDSNVVDTAIENQLNDMKFETAELILKMNASTFDQNLSIESKSEPSIDQKIKNLKWKVSYKELKEKALNTILKGVLLDWETIDINVYNLKISDIRKALLTKSIRREIKQKLLNWSLDIKDLKTRYESLWFTENDFIQYMEHIIYVDNDFDPLNIEQLQSAYNGLVQQESNYLWHIPNASELKNIKNKAYKQLMRQVKWSDVFLNKIIIPTYWDLTKARETFENLSIMANRVSAYDQQASKKWWKAWESFKKWWFLGFIDYIVNQTSMDATHKQMAETLWQIWVTIWLIVGFWKMLTSDCLLKSDDGKCKLKWWFFRSILFLGGSDFAYNWATKWKHSLPELIWAALTWWLDKSYIPWFGNKDKIRNTVWTSSIEQAKYNVEVRQQVTSPLLIKLLFPGEKISDFKKEIEDSSWNINIKKLTNYLELKAKKDSKYAFGYMLVKGIKDSNNSKELEQLKESVAEGIDMLDWYGNKTVDKIYDNEYLNRYKEVAEVKTKLYDTQTQLGNQTQEAIKQNKAKINEILKKYLKNKIDKQTMIKDLESISDLKTVMETVFTSKNSVKNNTTIPKNNTKKNPNINALLK